MLNDLLLYEKLYFTAIHTFRSKVQEIYWQKPIRINKNLLKNQTSSNLQKQGKPLLSVFLY